MLRCGELVMPFDAFRLVLSSTGASRWGEQEIEKKGNGNQSVSLYPPHTHAA